MGNREEAKLPTVLRRLAILAFALQKSLSL